MTDNFLKSIEKGSLVTLAGRPSMGKTLFMTSVLLNLLKQNKTCFFFSFDLSKEKLIQRILCCAAEIPFSKFLKLGFGTDKKEWEKLADAIETLRTSELLISDEVVTSAEISKTIKTAKEYKPDIIFIDYLQLIQSSDEKSRTEAISHIMKELKNIAEENNCTIFLSSQLSRAPENRKNKPPVLRDLRESKLIEELSDVVIFIHRPAYYDNDKDDPNVELIIAKNNYGECKTMNIEFNPNIPTFYIKD